MKAIFTTGDEWSGAILRVILGGIMLPHGAQKVFGWFGGLGYSGTMELFTTQMNIPAFIAFLVILAESAGALGLIIGFMSRIAAAGLAAVMVGAIAMVHWQHGFFMNWFGQISGEGYEYHLLVLGISIAVMIIGSGRWSLDRMISLRWPDQGLAPGNTLVPGT